jgi:hypothetical protein
MHPRLRGKQKHRRQIVSTDRSRISTDIDFDKNGFQTPIFAAMPYQYDR